MIVVSNTSPILNLGIIGQLDILERLYPKILIPESVNQELWKYSLKGELLPSLVSGWIETQIASNQSLINSLLSELHTGEAEAIALAIETKSDILLIDERRGHEIASGFGLNSTGILGILIEAKQKSLITKVRPIIDDLKNQANFWIKDDLYDFVLRIAEE